MLEKLIVAAVIVGAAYWYWTGPYQQQRHPDYATSLRQNDQDMAECIRAGNYRRGATGSGPGEELVEEACAQKYNLYKEDGHWHSYDRARPN